MDKDFEKQLEHVGVPAWHEKGIKGKGITVFCDDISNPSHYEYVKMIIETILPEATVLTGNIEYQIKDGNVIQSSINCRETGETLPFDEFILKNNVKLINNSTDGGSHDKDSAHAKFMREKIKEHNLIMTGSAGNGYGSPIDNKYYGAAIMVTGINDNKKSTYAEDTDIDFSMYTAGNTGTSFAAPFLLGMIGLLRCKYPKITQEEIIEYFTKSCENLGSIKIFGRGLALMGESKIKVVLTVGSDIMTVNGVDQKIDQPPEIKKLTKRTLVPVRAPFEAAGFTVDWDEKTKTITIER
jgi:hypothetical protein